MRVLGPALACLVLALPAGGRAQISAPTAAPAAAPADQTEVEAVVVTARRAGVPIWTVRRNAGTVILVGAANRIPRATPWRPAALEAAIARANAVILEPEVTGSAMGAVRAVMRVRTIGFLPPGETIASRYGAALDRRLAALAASGAISPSYTRTRPAILAHSLLKVAEGPHGDAQAPEVMEVARRAARRARIPRRSIMKAPASTVVDSIARDSPADAACLRNAVAAAEQGPAGAVQRGRDYAERRIGAVLASPIERAIDLCIEGRGQLGDALRASWRNTIETELGKPGVVVAVAPLRQVAGANGILDALQAAGADIQGPRWR